MKPREKDVSSNRREPATIGDLKGFLSLHESGRNQTGQKICPVSTAAWLVLRTKKRRLGKRPLKGGGGGETCKPERATLTAGYIGERKKCSAGGREKF